LIPFKSLERAEWHTAFLGKAWEAPVAPADVLLAAQVTTPLRLGWKRFHRHGAALQLCPGAAPDTDCITWFGVWLLLFVSFPQKFLFAPKQFAPI